jgi:hypothetical protein
MEGAGACIMNFVIGFLRDYGIVLAISLFGWAATQAFLRYERRVITSQLAAAERSLLQGTGNSEHQTSTMAPKSSATAPNDDADALRVHQLAIIHSRRRQAQRLVNQLEQEEARLRVAV